MFIKSNWKVMSVYLAVIFLGILVGALATGQAGWLWGRQSQAVAQAAEGVRQVDQTDNSLNATFLCNPSIIGTFPDHINVFCGNSAPGSIYNFSIPTSDFRNANRALSIMLTAEALGRSLFIYYDPNGDGSAYGCSISDCRPMTGVEMYYQ